MDWVAWQTISAVVSDAVLAATLFVFLVQARAMRQQTLHLARQTEHLVRDEDRSARATRAGVYQSLVQLMIDIDRIYIDRPELRCYFYDGADEPEDLLARSRVSALAETYADLMDNFLTQAQHLPEHLSGPYSAYFEDLARSSPAIRRFWRENREWYPEEMRQLLDPIAFSHQVPPQLPTAERQSKTRPGRMSDLAMLRD